MLTERDAQEADTAVRAIEFAAVEIEHLIDRARAKNWTTRVKPLRVTLANLRKMEHDLAGLFS